MTRWNIAALALGGSAIIGLAAWSGLAEAARSVAGALWVLPGLLAVHLAQLGLSGVAWRALAGPALTWHRAFRFRLVREGVNTLLPVAGVGGELVAVRLLVRRGMAPSHAGAATTLDFTTEVVALPVLLLCAACALLAMGGHRDVLPWLWGGLGMFGLGMGALVLAQRAGLLRLVEAALRRFAPASLRVDGLHDRIALISRDRRAVAAAFGLHLLSWSLGTFETWLAFWALGRPVSLAQAFVIESVGMAARGAGSAVPGSLGVQEGGFVLGAGLFGIPPEGALALSALKRLREVSVGVVGLGLWQWAEMRGRV